ncbi:MAG: bifunctional DNA-formamidopyrimidine glycosylase/DNA-(apurinic or apyrimidinic site) lyase [Gammaproteobacteria bacterium]|nr:bifunctional DNA-formamidopyrimidine glycosylase/DNA-(apurinic or apyrimidinic site) lyase [Gammaproteobacteria bacterium]MCY4165864.1 bifunctional DNA-formamidopyrimidine glycosylase/DNA-(apurinic or apyrimidinic site) lyase [Gammaproteobacteria bacterium]MCY4339971.1 bifunctional DNA-formamidopyrimidine glycosylase/DNA-(apurinic or apyrimidinic site) lyase [Gammaproteobacteria bacterium]
MPELPEVETTRRGIEPLVAGARVERVVVRERRLRWPIPWQVERKLTGARMLGVRRRAKYLLLESERGTAIAHLGMSGSFSVVAVGTEPDIHDHYDMVFDGGKALRFTDPRKFGSLLWGGREPLRHKLLADLGPEPFSAEFSGAWLKACSLGRRVAVKSFLMMPAVVAGVGNIYASEALYRAGIHPRRSAGRIALRRYDRLASAIRGVLSEAIEVGGTTLRDFADARGRPGYFSQRLDVYDRAGRNCRRCGSEIRRCVIGQRASYYCLRCQT